MDWNRCDEIEYDCRYENNNIVQTGKEEMNVTVINAEKINAKKRENFI